MIFIPSTTSNSSKSSCFPRPGVLLLTVLFASKLSLEHALQIQQRPSSSFSIRHDPLLRNTPTPCGLLSNRDATAGHAKKHSSIANTRPRSSLFSLVDIHSEGATATAHSPSGDQASKGSSSKPRFVIEKIGGGGGSGTRASSHASRYYGDYVSGKVYSDISSLCVQNFFGTTLSDIQQSLQTSTQKLELYQSLQPDELRKRRDDVRVTSEFFVAYELREATPQDVEDFDENKSCCKNRSVEEGRAAAAVPNEIKCITTPTATTTTIASSLDQITSQNGKRLRDI